MLSLFVLILLSNRLIKYFNSFHKLNLYELKLIQKIMRILHINLFQNNSTHIITSLQFVIFLNLLLNFIYSILIEYNLRHFQLFHTTLI